MKKKVLCVLQLPPPVHGVSIMNEYVINSKLLNETFEIKVIDLKFGKSIKDLQRFTFNKVYKSFLYGLKIAKNILLYKPDLIYFTISPTGFAFYRDAYYIFLIKLLRVKILIHLHGKGIEGNAMNSKLKNILYKRVFKQTNVICLSELLANDIKKVYGDTPFIIPNGIKNQLKSDFIAKQSYNRELQILYLSNFIKNKGILVLLDALAILKTQGFSFKAKLVGAPSNITIQELEKIIREEKLTSFIDVVGPLMGDAKFEAYKETDIFVFPTYNDSFPLVTLEAMQFGLPIVSTFEGSIPDIVINNETGFLVEKENPTMLAEKIAILLKDNNMRVAMGEKGCNRYIKNYTLEHFEYNMFKTFQKVLNK